MSTSAAPPDSRSRIVVVALCSAAIIIDGYDLIVYGTVVPTLAEGSAEWKLGAAEIGRIGSYALIGMLIGAMLIGTITDLVGRRRVMLGCIAWFSIAMAWRPPRRLWSCSDSPASWPASVWAASCRPPSPSSPRWAGGRCSGSAPAWGCCSCTG
ncbi:MFS transporter [Nonomuraea sp. NBC_00507]|uniref:MFS transporter n=1 Tax=Nonomuraea sp. NBC_00507 TaxID=2976002 RepID=UPI002E171955